MPKRIPSPHRATARPLIEPTTQPLYDSEVWSDTTVYAYFYKIPLGQNTVAGDPAIAGTSVQKTARHTNMTQAGKLPQPKLFLIRGWRLEVNLAPQLTSSDFPATLTVGGAYFGDGGHLAAFFTQYIQFSTTFEFWVGGASKRYAEGPSFLFPFNAGMNPQGPNSGAVGQRWANAVDMGGIVDAQAYHPWGLYYSTGRNPVTIAPGQDFGARLQGVAAIGDGSFREIFNSIAGISFQPNHHRLLYVFADGELAREVM